MDLGKRMFEVVPSNSVSTGSCDIVVYWGYGQMDSVGSILEMANVSVSVDFRPDPIRSNSRKIR